MKVNDTTPLTQRDVAALAWMMRSIAWCRAHGYSDPMHDDLIDMIEHRVNTDIDRLKAARDEQRKRWARAHLRLVTA